MSHKVLADQQLLVAAEENLVMSLQIVPGDSLVSGQQILEGGESIRWK